MVVVDCNYWFSKCIGNGGTANSNLWLQAGLWNGAGTLTAIGTNNTNNVSSLQTKWRRIQVGTLNLQVLRLLMNLALELYRNCGGVLNNNGATVSISNATNANSANLMVVVFSQTMVTVQNNL
jgi:hypothetical protein